MYAYMEHVRYGRRLEIGVWIPVTCQGHEISGLLSS